MIDANSNTPLLNKACTLLAMKEFDDAYECFNMVYKYLPVNPIVLLGRGIYFYEKKKYEEALGEFIKVDNFEGLFNSGVSCIQL